MKLPATISTLAMVWAFFCLAASATAQITNINVIGDTCNTLTLAFKPAGTTDATYFFWRFNDTASGTADTITNPKANPVHTFSLPGAYNVCLTYKNLGAAANTICRTVTIGLCCKGIIQSADSCLQNSVAFTLTTGANVSNIVWDFGDPASGANNSYTGLNPAHFYTAVGRYTVKATVHAPCGTFIDTFSQRVVKCVPPTCTAKILFNDSCLKTGANFLIYASYPVNAVTWDFGDPQAGNTNNIDIIARHRYSIPGKYSVTAQVNLGCGPVTIYRTINMVDCDHAAPCTGAITVTDSCLQHGSGFSINTAYAIHSIAWNFNDPSSSAANVSTATAPTHLFGAAQTYLVGAVVQLSCGATSLFKSVTIVNCGTPPANDSCKLYIPSGFTPNGDGKNDVFGPVSACALPAYTLSVFNRWGMLVYRNNNPANKWDGTCQTANCPIGNYIYIVNYQFAGQPPKTVKGSVVLVR